MTPSTHVWPKLGGGGDVRMSECVDVCGQNGVPEKSYKNIAAYLTASPKLCLCVLKATG